MKFTDPRKDIKRRPFPAWAGPAERLRFLLSYAIRAPSLLNTQPWLFEIEGSHLRAFMDIRRAVRSADPNGREMVMACGSAIENLSVAASHFGYRLEVKPVASVDDARLVASVRLGERERPEPEDEELFAAIETRRMGTVFYSDPAPGPLLAGLAREPGGSASACTLRLIPRWLARPVAELVAEGDAALWSSPRYRSEVAAWTRSQSRPLDGLPPGRTGPTAPAGLLRRLFRRGAKRPRELDRRCAEQTQTLLLLSSSGDRPHDWLNAGRALERLLLRAAAAGLVACPLNAAIEVPGLRTRLRAVIGDAQWPQYLLRLGYGPVPAASPRRPVALVLRSFATEPAAEETAVGKAKAKAKVAG